MRDFCLVEMGVREASVGMSPVHGGGKDEYRLELFHSVTIARVHGSERRCPRRRMSSGRPVKHGITGYARGRGSTVGLPAAVR